MISVVVCSILVWIFIEDLRRFKIRNVAVMILVACFALDCLVRNRLSLLAPHALFATLGLGLLFFAFARRMIGGGDAKLLSAALLWMGPEDSFTFALALCACTIVYAAVAWCGAVPSRKSGEQKLIPFGPSIATAWIAQMTLTAWVIR